ncbi:MAG TPA: hypothetical protein VKF62_07050 [Planctomycetota bacterium]|nr:hypothetical protein [Planctomycetota bacterium]
MPYDGRLVAGGGLHVADARAIPGATGVSDTWVGAPLGRSRVV